MSSLHAKIATGYYVAAAVVVALALFSYAGLKFLERRIAAGGVVVDLLQDTLEMRRNEKKYFLSNDPADLGAAIEYAEAGLGRLQSGRALLSRLASPDDVSEIDRQLTRYRELLARYDIESRAGRELLSEEVRAAGHHSSQIAKLLSRMERDDLSVTLHASRIVLVGFLVPLVVLVVLGGQALSRKILRPLRELESSLKPIAEGRYSHMEIPSTDREIVSFARAFNGMLSELQVRHDQLRHSERLASLGTLVSGVAHELNNPLGNISSSCQLLQEGLGRENPQRLRAWLAQIDGETDRGRGIVRALLDYARKSPLRPRQQQCVALEEILMHARTLAAPDPAIAAQITLEVPTELVIVADEERLQRIFINLFKNAFDAGSRQIRVTAWATTWGASPAPAGAYTIGGKGLHRAGAEPIILVRVEDDGPGILPQHLPRIFDPFFTTRDVGRGTGLGLFIAQEIVQEQGGCIAAENRAEGGTCFTLWLPAGCEHRAV